MTSKKRFGLGLASAVLALTASLPVQAKPNGAHIYAENCARCHLNSGRGVEGLIPSLRQSAVVKLTPAEREAIIRSGLHGVKVNGVAYTGQMPAFKGRLSNAEITAVAAYVGSAWGNTLAPAHAVPMKSRH
jgi:mono/diheme cytochrome c family protein